MNSKQISLNGDNPQLMELLESAEEFQQTDWHPWIILIDLICTPLKKSHVLERVIITLIYIEASYPAGWVTHLAGLNDASYHTKQLSNLRSPVVLKII